MTTSHKIAPTKKPRFTEYMYARASMAKETVHTTAANGIVILANSPLTNSLIFYAENIYKKTLGTANPGLGTWWNSPSRPAKAGARTRRLACQVLIVVMLLYKNTCFCMLHYTKLFTNSASILYIKINI